MPSFQKKLSKEWSVSWRPPKSQKFYIVSFWLKWVSLLKTNQHSLSIWTRLKRLLVSKAAQLWQFFDYLKFIYFLRMPQKFEQSSLWFWRLLRKCKNHKDNCPNFCCLLSKVENFFDLISSTALLCDKTKSRDMTAR